MTPRERFEEELACSFDEDYRAIAVARCKWDVVYWINAFVWTFDPRLDGYDCWQPFLLHPVQEECAAWLLHNIKWGIHCGIEKSRDMGASWINLAVFVHQWLFEWGFTAKVGSLSEDMVDKSDDKDCLFWKIKFIIENLPDWMKPAGWDVKKCTTFMKVQNPANGSVITGAAPTSQFGIGGRQKAILMDELGFWEMAKTAWDNCAETTNCRIANSTPNGMNHYGKLMNPEEGQEGLPKFILDWHDYPGKNAWVAYDSRGQEIGRGQGWGKDAPNGTKKLVYPWYEAKRAYYNYDTVVIARMLDRDYKKSLEGRVYPQFDYVVTGRFGYDPNLATFCSWDIGNDATAITWWQYDPRKKRCWTAIDYVEASDKLIDWFVPFFTGFVPSGAEEGYTDEEKEMIRFHSGWRIDGHFGDPSGKARNQVIDLTVYDVLDAYGIEVITNDMARTHGTRISATRKFLLQVNVDSVRCKKLIAAMQSYRWPRRAEGSNHTGENDKPVHDKNSHGATSVEYMAVNNPFRSEQIGARPDYDRDYVVRNVRSLYEEDEREEAGCGITGYGPQC